MLELQNGSGSVYKKWNTNGVIKKRELLAILREVGEDDDIWLNVTAGEMCNESPADEVSLFEYSRHEGEAGRFELTFSYRNEV